MIEKSIIMIISMYCLTICLLSGQFMLGDPYGFTLKNFNGEPIPSAILNTARLSEFNEASNNILETDFDGTVDGREFDRVVDFNVGMAFTVWEFVSILTGTYIFYILYFLGIPYFVVGGMMVIYSILLFRTIAGILRGF